MLMRIMRDRQIAFRLIWPLWVCVGVGGVIAVCVGVNMEWNVGQGTNKLVHDIYCLL